MIIETDQPSADSPDGGEPQAATDPNKSRSIIFEATLASGPSGAVEWGAELSLHDAVARRKLGLDIVARGDDEVSNKKLARAVEEAVGSATKPQPPHTNRAGKNALPHFHQKSRSPGGHSFYETEHRKARRKR